MENTSREVMLDLLQRQKKAHLSDGIPSAQKRIDWIDRCISALIKDQDKIVEALREDFGHRSKDQSMFTDIVASIDSLKHAKKHVHKWMRPEKRKPISPLGFLGAKARVELVCTA